MASFLTCAESRSAAAADICGLLTVEEVSASLNERIQAPQSIQTGGCLWRGTGTDSVTLEAPGTGRPGFENAETRISPIVRLTGIGDAAFVFMSAAGFVEIGFLKADNFFTLLVQARDAKSARGAAESLASIIASRL